MEPVCQKKESEFFKNFFFFEMLAVVFSVIVYGCVQINRWQEEQEITPEYYGYITTMNQPMKDKAKEFLANDGKISLAEYRVIAQMYFDSIRNEAKDKLK